MAGDKRIPANRRNGGTSKEPCSLLTDNLTIGNKANSSSGFVVVHEGSKGNALRRHYEQGRACKTKPIRKGDRLMVTAGRKKSYGENARIVRLRKQSQSDLPGEWCARHTLRNGGGLVMRNKANLQVARLALTVLQEKGYERKHGLCVCENKANLDRTGSREQPAGRQVADHAKQSQTWEEWGIWGKVNIVCGTV